MRNYTKNIFIEFIDKNPYKKIAILSILAIFLGILSGCSKNENVENKVNNEKEIQQLVVSNTDLFIDREMVKKFEKEYNCKVIDSFFEENEEMYTKLKTNAEIYDVVCASDYMVDILKNENLLEKLDKSKLENFKNIDTKYLNLSYDLENNYSVPYTVGNIGIAYSPSKISGITKWADLWDEKYKGEVTMLNGSRFTLSAAMLKLGIDPTKPTKEDINLAKEELVKQKQNVKAYIGDDQAKDMMISGETNLTMIWGGEALLAKAENPDVEFVYPEEGAIFIIDNWVIPKNAKNKELAYKWLDFMLRTEVSAKNCEEVKYGSPILGAEELMSEELQGNPILIPDEKTFENGYILNDLGNELNEVIEKAWTEFKSN